MSKRIAKKRIAVFANGWNGANIKGFIDGLKKSLPENYADFFMFVSYASYGLSDDWIKAEHKIYDLPDLKTFDGASHLLPCLVHLRLSLHLVCHLLVVRILCQEHLMI